MTELARAPPVGLVHWWKPFNSYPLAQVCKHLTVYYKASYL